MTTNQRTNQAARILRQAKRTCKIARLNGRRGTDQTARIVRRKIREGAASPVVLALRDELVRDLPAHDKRGEARAVYDFVERAVRYTDDPPGLDTGKGAPWTVREHLAGRRVPGDCVTQTILTGALLRSLRIPVRLKVQSRSQAYRNYYHIYPEARIGGAWQPCDVTAATAAERDTRASAGVGYRHPAGHEKSYDVKGVNMLVMENAGLGRTRRRIMRGRRTLGSLGAEKPADTKAPADDTESAQQKVAKAGGSGSIWSDLLGVVTGIFGGVGSASRRRKARTAAQLRLDKQWELARALVADSEKYQGKKLTDHLFGTLMNEVGYIHGNTQTSASDYFAGGTYGT